MAIELKPGEKRLIDYDEIRRLFDAQYKETVRLIHDGETHLDNLAEGFTEADRIIQKIQSVDAVEVVRCKECRFAKPYERMDGKTGYYCQFCGHSFKYGTNWERLYNPVKESDDFCSYGERRSNA